MKDWKRELESAWRVDREEVKEMEAKDKDAGTGESSEDARRRGMAVRFRVTSRQRATT